MIIALAAPIRTVAKNILVHFQCFILECQQLHHITHNVVSLQDRLTLEGSGIALMRGQRLLYEGVEFALRNGELLVLRGPNGSGKSSLLRAVAGFLPLISGQISCNKAPLASALQTGAIRCFWHSSADGLAGGQIAHMAVKKAGDGKRVIFCQLGCYRADIPCLRQKGKVLSRG